MGCERRPQPNPAPPYGTSSLGAPRQSISKLALPSAGDGSATSIHAPPPPPDDLLGKKQKKIEDRGGLVRRRVGRGEAGGGEAALYHGEDEAGLLEWNLGARLQEMKCPADSSSRCGRRAHGPGSMAPKAREKPDARRPPVTSLFACR